MSISTQSTLQSAGEVHIEQLFLVSNNGSISLLDYLVELNIYESIFNNVVSGDLLLSDSRNLIKEYKLLGDEYLIVKVTTPGLSNTIYKTFKITSIEDRMLVRDQNTQIYKFRFISQEAIVDSLSPLYNSFSGQIDTIVNKIFTDNLEISRNFIFNETNNKLTQGKDITPLVVFSEAANKVKFVSPAWSPFQCINWLAKKSLPKSGQACNFLFWETNRAFYFGSLENIFDTGISIGSYEYKATGVLGPSDDTIEKMALIQSVDILNGLDHLDNLENGYFASKLVSLDIFKKQREITDYDHVTKFSSYKHLSRNNPIPLFNYKGTVRNLNSHTRVYPTLSKLHTGIENNYNERMGELYGNRLSNLIELNSLKLNISIYGRTDVEAGRLIDIKFPDMSPVDETDIATEHLDSRFSGSYLITSIHHKINFLKHTMSMEVVRDSLSASSADSLRASSR
jgi:hypothetical protein